MHKKDCAKACARARTTTPHRGSLPLSLFSFYISLSNTPTLPPPSHSLSTLSLAHAPEAHGHTTSSYRRRTSAPHLGSHLILHSNLLTINCSPSQPKFRTDLHAQNNFLVYSAHPITNYPKLPFAYNFLYPRSTFARVVANILAPLPVAAQVHG